MASSDEQDAQKRFSPPSCHLISSPPMPPKPSPHPTSPFQHIVQVPSPIFETEPARARCHQCMMMVTTEVKKSFSSTGWLCCCFCVGIWSICFDSSYAFAHRCPNCRMLLGYYRPHFSAGMILCAVGCIFLLLIFILVGPLGQAIAVALRN